MANTTREISNIYYLELLLRNKYFLNWNIDEKTEFAFFFFTSEMSELKKYTN